MSVESVSSEFHLIKKDGANRKISYALLGEFDAKHIFICLPGLLQTSESFHPLLHRVIPFDDCCWLSVDYCGRGDSDPLPPNSNYSFSKYLADIEDLIASLILPSQTESNRKLHLIGTSMGGILAMHLVKRFQNKFDTVVLNDIGLCLHWTSLISLYQHIKESDMAFTKLKVDARAIQAVRSQSHFDLPYEFDLLGLRFYSLLQNFSGQVVLLHNSASPICPLNVANQSKTIFADLKIWTIEKHGHPVDWDTSTVKKLSQLVNLKTKPIEQADLQVSINAPELVQVTSTFRLDFIDTFLKISQTYLESTAEDPRLWLRHLLNRLKFWKRSIS